VDRKDQRRVTSRPYDDAVHVSLLRRRRLLARHDFDSDYLIEMEPHVCHYDLYSATSPDLSRHQ
jgi:hypothetical protein